MSLCLSLEQNLIDENQNFFNGNYSYIFSNNLHIFWNLLEIMFQKECKIFPKIFGIFGFKSSKLRRFFDIWKWTKDEDEDGSSDKNLRRSKTFEASLQLCYIQQKKTDQCCNEALMIFEASKIFVRRSIFVFIFGSFSDAEESSKLRRF